MKPTHLLFNSKRIKIPNAPGIQFCNNKSIRICCIAHALELLDRLEISFIEGFEEKEKEKEIFTDPNF